MNNLKYWSQLQYNSFYHSYHFIASKFIGDYSNILNWI